MNKPLTKRAIVAIVTTIFLVQLFSLSAYATQDIASSEFWLETANEVLAKKGFIGNPTEALAKYLSICAGKNQLKYKKKVSDTLTEHYVSYPVIVMYNGTILLDGKPVSDDTIEIKTFKREIADFTLLNLMPSTPLFFKGSKAEIQTDAIDIYVSNFADVKAYTTINNKRNYYFKESNAILPRTDTAMGLLAGSLSIINILFGLIVIVLSIGMTVFSSLDIIYLAFPAFRDKIDAQVEAGGIGARSNKDGTVSSRWVTDDAREAVREANEAQTQPWGGYLKRRAVAYVFLAIILFILLTGNIFAITTLVSDALGGLFEAMGLN